MGRLRERPQVRMLLAAVPEKLQPLRVQPSWAQVLKYQTISQNLES